MLFAQLCHVVAQKNILGQRESADVLLADLMSVIKLCLALFAVLSAKSVLCFCLKNINNAKMKGMVKT
jgi:hypothetical protein